MRHDRLTPGHPPQARSEQLGGLPLSPFQTAENDVLREEGENCAHKLDEAGVDVTTVRDVTTVP